MAKKAPLKIHIVLDTNIVFTDAAEHLLSLEAKNLIAEASKSEGVEITWYLPRVVRVERRYQMIDRATKLMPSLAKLEALLGHKLGISEEIIHQRVDAAITEQMTVSGLVELGLDESKEWYATYTTTGKLTKPTLESVVHSETDWED